MLAAIMAAPMLFSIAAATLPADGVAFFSCCHFYFSAAYAFSADASAPR